MMSLVTSTAAWSTARSLTSRRVSLAMASTVAGDVSTEVSGEVGTESYRLNFKANGAAMSPWHDLPLGGEGGVYNMLTEIPKYSKAKVRGCGEGCEERSEGIDGCEQYERCLDMAPTS